MSGQVSYIPWPARREYEGTKQREGTIALLKRKIGECDGGWEMPVEAPRPLDFSIAGVSMPLCLLRVCVLWVPAAPPVVLSGWCHDESAVTMRRGAPRRGPAARRGRSGGLARGRRAEDRRLRRLLDHNRRL